jgi:hypothetical protein
MSTSLQAQPESSSPKCAWMHRICLHPKHFKANESACIGCADYMNPPRGAGDVVHAITTATGIGAAVKAVTGGDCGGCAKRRAALNAALPFTDKPSKDGN